MEAVNVCMIVRARRQIVSLCVRTSICEGQTADILSCLRSFEVQLTLGRVIVLCLPHSFLIIHYSGCICVRPNMHPACLAQKIGEEQGCNFPIQTPLAMPRISCICYKFSREYPHDNALFEAERANVDDKEYLGNGFISDCSFNLVSTSTSNMRGAKQTRYGTRNDAQIQ